jgi:hypothetical protein
MRYLLSKDYKNSGPFEVNLLRDMIRRGEIGKGYYVCAEGTDNWTEITETSEFKRDFTAPPQPKNEPPPSSHIGSKFPFKKKKKK